MVDLLILKHHWARAPGETTDIPEDTWGRKPTMILNGIAEPEKAGPKREVDLPSTVKEKPDDLDPLWLKSDSDKQGSAISEEKDNIPTLEKSSTY